MKRFRGNLRLKYANMIVTSGLFVLIAGVALSCDDGAVVIGPGPGFPGNPTAVASADPLTGDSPLIVTFSAEESTDPDGKIVRWQWDFENDGTYDWSSTTSGTVTHEYAAGEYTAKLLVTDDDGKSAIATVEDIISSDAHLYWTFEKVDGGVDAGYAAGDSVSIADKTSIDNPVLCYRSYDALNGIKLAFGSASGNWTFEIPSLGGDFVDISNAIRLTDGSIFVACYENLYDYDYDLLLVKRSPDGVWSEEVVDSIGGSHPILSASESGTIMISYLRGSTKTIALKKDGQWTFFPFDNEANFRGYATSAAFNPDGNPVLLTGDTLSKPVIITLDNDTWNVSYIISNGALDLPSNLLFNDGGWQVIAQLEGARDFNIYLYSQTNDEDWSSTPIMELGTDMFLIHPCKLVSIGSQLGALFRVHSWNPLHTRCYFVYQNGSSWKKEVISDKGNEFAQADVAVYPDGSVLVAALGYNGDKPSTVGVWRRSSISISE
jgi:PKD repeat protein